MYSKKTSSLYSCKAENMLKLLGKKWSSSILKKFSIDKKELSFTELKKDLNISQKILDQRLKELEKYDILEKNDHYHITELGLKINEIVYELEKLF